MPKSNRILAENDSGTGFTVNVTRVSKTAVLVALGALALLSVSSAQTVHTNDSESLFPAFYDASFVLCCGTDLDDKPFCENLMRSDCDTYNGRSVEDCSQCRGATSPGLNSTVP